MSSGQVSTPSVVVGSTCPFCQRSNLKRLGNHLPYCKERNGRDYSSFLSKKTLAKKTRSSCKSHSCPKCHKRFSRLDTHLRISATCRSVSGNEDSSMEVTPAPSSSSPSQLQSSHHDLLQPANLEQDIKPRLCLPASEEGWKKANEYLSHNIVPMVIQEPSVDLKNAILVEGVYSYFSTEYGTKEAA